MDLLKLELRNLFGILLPGALLLLVIIYAVTVIPVSLDHSFFQGVWGTGGHSGLTLVVSFVLSYLLGSVLRLNSCEYLDEKSQKFLQKRYARGAPPLVSEAWLGLKPEPSETTVGCFDGLWAQEAFPYPAFQLLRQKLYGPQEAYRQLYLLLCRLRPENDSSANKTSAAGKAVFNYRKLVTLLLCWLRPEDDSPANEISAAGKAVFNYCKLVICSTTRQRGDELLHEVRSAEAEVRFFAGTYYALFGGAWMLCGALACRIVTFYCAQRSLWEQSILLPFISVLILWLAHIQILYRFRTLRLKEVDLVFNAFYLVLLRKPRDSWPDLVGTGTSGRGDPEKSKAVSA